LEWKREQRRQKKIAQGKNPLTKAEIAKLRTKRKMQTRGRLVAEIMASKGTKDQTSKEDLEDARRQAKRQMRQLKKEKRNKMIHRKKTGSNLAGVYGGQT